MIARWAWMAYAVRALMFPKPIIGYSLAWSNSYAAMYVSEQHGKYFGKLKLRIGKHWVFLSEAISDSKTSCLRTMNEILEDLESDISD